MKILIFNSLYHPNIIGGAERSVQILAEGLRKKNISPVVVSTSERDYIDYINGIKVYYVKTPNLYWMKNAKEQLKWKKPFWHLIDAYNPFIEEKISKILEEEKLNLVHTNNLAGFSVGIWKVAKKYNLPVLHTIRDYYLLCPFSTMFKKGKNCEEQCTLCKFYSIPKKLLSNRYVDGVVGVSEFILNKHLKFGYFKNSKTKTWIYNPISLYKSSNLRKTNLKKEIMFGLVGLISPTKGTEFVLERFRRLNLSNAKLFVYGRGITKEYEEKLKSKYACSDIVFKGFRKPEEIYSEIDISIIPSLWHEPFSRVLIESYSYGIPVLASNSGGIPENVVEGKTGFLFDPEKERDFEEKLKKSISSFRNGYFLPEKIVKFAQKFKTDLVVEEYVKQYRAILNVNNIQEI